MLAVMVWETALVGGDITWLLWVALGFFGLMVLVGWLSSRRKKIDSTQQEPKHHTSKEQD
jgi:LPXTG-motif cell wall-anchored protein